MRNRMCAIASHLAVAALLVLGASTVEASTIAGWDFSQYRGSGSLAPFTTTLPANYSDLDPSGNAGAGAGTVGTMTLPNSTDVLPTGGTMNCSRRNEGGDTWVGGGTGARGCAVPDIDGPVRSNRREPWKRPGANAFDSFTILKYEGQTYQNRLALEATNTADVVFEANPTGSWSNWSVSFGARVVSGGGDDGGPLSCDPAGASECTATVDVDFSTDGSTYTNYGSCNLTTKDNRCVVPLAPGASAAGYVKLGIIPGSNGAYPLIDNVAITAVPEPGMVMMLVAGAALLAVLPRRG